MPDAKRSGAVGPPPVYQCSIQDHQDGHFGGLTPTSITCDYTTLNSVQNMINIPVNTVGVETLTICVVVIDDGNGSYDAEIDGTPVSDVDMEYWTFGPFTQMFVCTATVPAGAHVVSLNLVGGGAVNVYQAIVKVLVTKCISVT